MKFRSFFDEIQAQASAFATAVMVAQGIEAFEHFSQRILRHAGALVIDVKHYLLLLKLHGNLQDGIRWGKL
jgi:hypothetical protein